MTKQTFILITTIVAAGVALTGIGGQIGATAKEQQQVHNVRSRLVAAQEYSGPAQAEPAEAALGESEK